MVYDQQMDPWGYPITTAATQIVWSSTSYYTNYVTRPISPSKRQRGLCLRPSYGAAAQPPQPPPVDLSMCTKEPLPKIVLVDGKRFAWFPKRQSGARERSSRRRRLRAWEA